jgi:hypothetical protein
LLRGGNRFSEKHALGLDPRDHAQTKEPEHDGDSTSSHHALEAQTALCKLDIS